MSIQLEQHVDRLAVDAAKRRLILIWRRPSDRKFIRVAQLEALESGQYRFAYEPDVDGLLGFSPLDEYPNLTEARVLSYLPAFFQNRIMNSERGIYASYVSWLGLEGYDAEEIPLEILVRSGGGRATDTFHIVEEPVVLGGEFLTRFFVSGISHVSGAEARIQSLSADDGLVLRDDPNNPVNPLAVALDRRGGGPIGWVPDWLCGELESRRAEGFLLKATIERVNSHAPAHVRVLCRIAGRREQVGL